MRAKLKDAAWTLRLLLGGLSISQVRKLRNASKLAGKREIAWLRSLVESHLPSESVTSYALPVWDNAASSNILFADDNKPTDKIEIQHNVYTLPKVPHPKHPCYWVSNVQPPSLLGIEAQGTCLCPKRRGSPCNFPPKVAKDCVDFSPKLSEKGKK